MIVLFLTSAFGYNYLDECSGTPTHWDVQPSVWVLNKPDGQPIYDPLADDAVVTAIEAGWSIWSDTTSCCTGWLTENGGTTLTGADASDLENVVTFTPATWDPAHGDASLTLAVTLPNYSVSDCGIDTADQIYNTPNFVFGTATPPDAGTVDLQGVAAHENGHWLGLGHSDDSAATMYFSSAGVDARDLDADDEAAVCNSQPGNCEGPQELCDNGIDDDLDGLTDCFDDVCDRDPRCTCPLTVELSCDTPVSGTTTGGLLSVDDWACASTLAGPDVTFQFTGSDEERVTFRLTDQTANLDLIVGPLGVNGGCESQSCSASTNPDLQDEVVENYLVDPGEVLAVTVDGADLAGGDFTILADCPGGEQPTCLANRAPLTCGSNLDDTNSTEQNQRDDWSCSQKVMSGPESVYPFMASEDGPVSLSLTGLTADLDLLVINPVDDACDAGTCLASTNATDGTSESLTFNATAGSSYLIVVDGAEAVASDYQLAVTCGEEEPSGGCSTTRASAFDLGSWLARR